MKERKLLLALLLLPFYFIVSCAKMDMVYYPKYIIGMYKDNKASETYAATLFWGEKLEFMKETNIYTNTENKEVIIYKVKRLSDGLEGYVNKAYLIQNPIAPGVILQDQAVIYDTPSVISPKKNVVSAPALCYVVEKKEPDWFKIEIFNPPDNYAFKAGFNKIYGQKWIQTNYVSLNKADVNIIIASLIALNNFRTAKAAYDKNPNLTNETKLNQVRQAEEQSLRSQMNASLSSEAVSLVQQILNIISPQPAQEENAEETEDTTDSEEDL